MMFLREPILHHADNKSRIWKKSSACEPVHGDATLSISEHKRRQNLPRHAQEWEKGRKELAKERKREREGGGGQKEDENECEEFFNKPASLQQRRVRAANWHEAVVAVSHVQQ